MNFLAGLLLTYLPREAEAYCALSLLMRQRGLREMYLPDMSLLQIRLWQLSKLLPPRLAAHLEAHAVLPVLYVRQPARLRGWLGCASRHESAMRALRRGATPREHGKSALPRPPPCPPPPPPTPPQASSWLITCFASDFPFHFAARVMDVLLTGHHVASPVLKARPAPLGGGGRCTGRLGAPAAGRQAARLLGCATAWLPPLVWAATRCACRPQAHPVCLASAVPCPAHADCGHNREQVRARPDVHGGL